MKKNYFLFSLLLFSSALFAQNTGWVSPSALYNPNGWTTPANAYKSDDVYTTVVHGAGCRCPWINLSWDGGSTYTTSTHLLGPYGTVDSYRTTGSATDNWGHSWIDTEFSNAKFRLKITNPGLSVEQGYGDFNFSIPANATILGLEVQVEEHGDSAYAKEFVDLIQARIYYSTSTGMAADRGTFNSMLNVYPNPASTAITITTDEGFDNIALVILYDMQGREVKRERIDTQTVSTQLDLSDLRKGIYLLQVQNDKGNISSKKITIE